MEQPVEASDIAQLLRGAYRAMRESAATLFDQDISFSQWMALKVVDQCCCRSIRDLSKQIGVDAGATTRLVDQLEEKRLLRRVRTSADRRVVKLEITDRGRSTVEAMSEKLANFWTEKLRGFANSELFQLKMILHRLNDDLRKPLKSVALSED